MDLEIDKLLLWSEPELKDTKRGLRNLRKAAPDASFWQLWNNPAVKQQLVAREVSLGKDWKTGTVWEVCWWADPPPELVQNQEVLREASRALDADIDIPCPPGLAYRPYQKAAVAYALKRLNQNLLPGALPRGGILYADEQRLGKTWEAIGVINCIPSIKTGLIICPTSVKINWYRELKRLLVREASVWIADPSMFPATDFVIINYQILHKYLPFIHKPDRWDIIIIDECHNLKDRNARQTKCVFGYVPRRNDQEESANPMPALTARVRIAMSGTPMPNEPKEIFPVLQWLDPITFGNYWRFVYGFCGAQKGEYGLVMDSRTVSFHSLQTKLRSTLMVRRLAKEVIKDMPPRTREIIEFESDDTAILAERTAFESKAAKLSVMEAKIELLKASGNKTDYETAVKQLSADIALVFKEIAELRMKVARIKLPYVLEYIKERIEQGEKIVSFGYHRFLIEALWKTFPGSVIHYGGMSEADKQISVDRFMQDDKCMLFSGSIIASREGLTLSASNHAVFPEFDWRPGVISQAEQRIQLPGKPDPILITHLVLKDSLDSNMIHTTLDKQSILDEALDEKTPIELAASNHVSLSLDDYDRKANSMVNGQVNAIHQGLKILAASCDGARTPDGIGFNPCDTMIGKSLAAMKYLTNRQGVLGLKIIRKYKRQLPEELLKEINP